MPHPLPTSLLIALVASLACLRGTAGQAPDRPVEAVPPAPNIVYILADDLGYGDPRCYNAASRIPTAHIDALAGAGMRFTDAHSASSVCTPTRYAILTGRYAWRSTLKRGVLWGASQPLIEADRPTVASVLKSRGYITGCIGKWHLGLGWKTARGTTPNDADTVIDYARPVTGGPVALGFDEFFGIPASLDMAPYVYLRGDRVVTAPTASIEKRGGLAYYRGGTIAPDFDHERVLPDLTREAVSFIDRHAPADAPFFLYFPLPAPHTPVLPVESARGRSQAGEYGDFVVQVDDTVGAVLDALERNGVTNETLVVFTSDNGSTMQPMRAYDHLPSAHLAGRKSDAWEGGHRVPFIVRWPGVVAAGSTFDETTCQTDLMATVAAISGAVLPAGAGEDSISILPALTGSLAAETPLRETTIHHSINGTFAIRHGRWKLILGRGSGGWSSKGAEGDPEVQLYDLSADVSESTNVFDRYPDVVADLRARLDGIRGGD